MALLIVSCMSRLQKIDQYVDERKLQIEQVEAASRAELEEASKRLDARCETLHYACRSAAVMCKRLILEIDCKVAHVSFTHLLSQGATGCSERKRCCT